MVMSFDSFDPISVLYCTLLYIYSCVHLSTLSTLLNVLYCTFLYIHVCIFRLFRPNVPILILHCLTSLFLLQSWYALAEHAGLAVIDDEAETIDVDEEIDREVAELFKDMTKEDIEMLTMDEEEAEEEDARKALADNKDKILRGTVHLQLNMQYNINMGRKT